MKSCEGTRTYVCAWCGRSVSYTVKQGEPDPVTLIIAAGWVRTKHGWCCGMDYKPKVMGCR